MHYWRLDRDKWDGILKSVKAMGFTMISIYMPWEAHEIERGTFDYSGNKDIDAFLTLIESKGLRIVVRPGPADQLGADLVRLSRPDPRRPRAAGAQRPGHEGGPHAGPAADPGAELRGRQVLRRDGALVRRDHADPREARLPEGSSRRGPGRQRDGVLLPRERLRLRLPPGVDRPLPASSARSTGRSRLSTRRYGQRIRSFAEVDPPRRFEATRPPQDIPWYTDWIEYPRALPRRQHGPARRHDARARPRRHPALPQLPAPARARAAPRAASPRRSTSWASRRSSTSSASTSTPARSSTSTSRRSARTSWGPAATRTSRSSSPASGRGT